MKFKHRYGAVELELQEEEDGPAVWARVAGPVSQSHRGPLFDTIEGPAPRENASGDERELVVYRRVGVDWNAVEWRVYTRHTVECPPHGTVVYRVEADDSLSLTRDSETHSRPLGEGLAIDPGVLEAAYVLLMDDRAAFEAADRAMGDPYP